MKHNKEEIKKFYAQARLDWKTAKELSLKMDELSASELSAIQKQIPKMSGASYMFTKIQMKTQGFEGLPGLDCKTFDLWKKSGYKVRKGEISKIKGLTRLTMDDNEFVFPKIYSLFHISQVEAIA